MQVGPFTKSPRRKWGLTPRRTPTDPNTLAHDPTVLLTGGDLISDIYGLYRTSSGTRKRDGLLEQNPAYGTARTLSRTRASSVRVAAADSTQGFTVGTKTILYTARSSCGSFLLALRSRKESGARRGEAYLERECYF
jgi:hypothetical protein